MNAPLIKETLEVLHIIIKRHEKKLAFSYRHVLFKLIQYHQIHGCPMSYNQLKEESLIGINVLKPICYFMAKDIIEQISVGNDYIYEVNYIAERTPCE